MKNFYDLVCKNGFYSKPERLKHYLENYLFKGIDFKGKSLIDIGGGNGLFGFYAALNGAKKVVVMEPEFDGSSSGMIKEFHQINSLFGDLKNIEHTTKVLEEYDVENNNFDVILMHNSINHIDEDACIVLDNDPAAQDKYLAFFKLLKKISNPNSKLLVCDCSRKNLLNDLGIKNPMAPTIEWDKHQAPEFWADMLKKVGFEKKQIKWSSPNLLGSLGRTILGNSLGAYMTYSHFRLEMDYKEQ